MAHRATASQGEINPEGLEVAETMRPQASRAEIDPRGLVVAETIGPRAELDEGIEVVGDHSTPSPATVGSDQGQEDGQNCEGGKWADVESKAKSDGAHDGGRAKMFESGLIGHAFCAKMRSHVFKAKKGGGLEIVEGFCSRSR